MMSLIKKKRCTKIEMILMLKNTKQNCSKIEWILIVLNTN